MHVAVDATALLIPITGVGAFTQALVDGLSTRDDVELTLFPVSVRGRGRLAARTPAGARSVAPPLPATLLRGLWQRFPHPAIDPIFGRRRPDLVHGPNFVVPPARAARVATVHDLTPLRFPELCRPATLAYPPLIERQARDGAWHHTVSFAARDELLQSLAVDPDRVVAVPNGVTPLTGDAAAGRRAAGHERYVLALGTVEPRKDLPGLIAAFDAIAGDHPDLHLVHAGGDGWGVEAYDAAVTAARHRDRIHRLGYVDDGTRGDLLAGAALFAYPSVYEGFGLPPLEAMSVGTPVVTTLVPAIAEVCGDAARLVPVGDRDALAAAMDEVLTGDALRARLAAAGAERVARYPWSATVDGIVELYHRVLADH